jgi:hypothetical protein
MTGLLEALNRREQKEVLRKYIASFHPNAQAIACSCSSLDKQIEVLEINFSCQVPHFYTKVDDKVVFKPGQLTTRKSHQYSLERAYPLVFDCQRCDRETIAFHIPQGYEVKESPRPMVISTDFGEYRAEVCHQEEALLYTRESTQAVERVSNEDIADYLQFREQVASCDQMQVVLEKRP